MGFVLVMNASAMILKMLERSVYHVNSGERQDELQIYNIINCVDDSFGFIWGSNISMIDKYIIKFCEVMDRFTGSITNFLFAPRCKCGKKKDKK